MSRLSKEKYLSKLYKDNKQRTFKTAFSILKNNEQAEDAVQEAFLRVIKDYSKLCTYSCNENASYLVLVVRGISLNMLIKNKKFVELDDELQSDDNTEQAAEMNIAYEQIVQNIEKLTPALKNIATLLWVKHLSEKEVAELLDMNISSVRSSASRARKQLIQMNSEWFDYDK